MSPLLTEGGFRIPTMEKYSSLLIMMTLCGATVGAMILLGSLLGPKRPGKVKDLPFECGETPFQLPTDRFTIRFYLIAMLFILFDIEIVFLFPWAVVFKTLKTQGLVSILVFIGVLGAGYVYAWKKGALEWE
jgi:NADH-quinone oxidoreductase subunit A